MADVTGPISSLPGAFHAVPKEMKCDEHPNYTAYYRVQGETDSFGCEMIDMCAICYTKHQKEKKEADHSGFCDWCKCGSSYVRPRRDFEEGSCGRVYMVCTPCIDKENKALNEEINNFESDYDDDFGYDPYGDD